MSRALTGLVRDILVIVSLMSTLLLITYCGNGNNSGAEEFLEASGLVKTTKSRFTIVYSNDVLGETEPCG